MARQLTENPDDMVNTEEEISFDNLTITGNYSDYDILEERKGNYYRKQQHLGQNQKINMERESTVNSSQLKKEDSENLKIKWIDSRKEDRTIIKNVSLKYFKKEFWCPQNSTLMVHTWRKQSMISALKSDKGKNK